jgi:hypothetical protein
VTNDFLPCWDALSVVVSIILRFYSAGNTSVVVSSVSPCNAAAMDDCSSPAIVNHCTGVKKLKSSTHCVGSRLSGRIPSGPLRAQYEILTSKLFTLEQRQNVGAHLCTMECIVNQTLASDSPLAITPDR